METRPIRHSKLRSSAEDGGMINIVDIICCLFSKTKFLQNGASLRQPLSPNVFMGTQPFVRMGRFMFLGAAMKVAILVALYFASVSVL